MDIREINFDDREICTEFFKNMGGETRAFFNRNNGNFNSLMRFFDGKDKNSVRWIAVENNSVKGYFFVWDTDTKIPWMGIALSEDMKGKHFGEVLINHIKSWCEQNDKGGVLLTTHVANTRAQALYERCGFEKMGMHQNGEVLYLLRFR